MVQIAISTPGLMHLIGQLASSPGVIRAEMKTAMKDATNEIRRQERARIPKRTGKLAGSVRTSVSAKATGETTGKVYPKKPYAHMVEGGTRPHVIRPKKGRFLHFGGAFVRVIHHPGARAHPFVQQALSASQGAIQAAFDGAMERLAAHIVSKGRL